MAIRFVQHEARARRPSCTCDAHAPRSIPRRGSCRTAVILAARANLQTEYCADHVAVYAPEAHCTSHTAQLGQLNASCQMPKLSKSTLRKPISQDEIGTLCEHHQVFELAASSAIAPRPIHSPRQFMTWHPALLISNPVVHQVNFISPL